MTYDDIIPEGYDTEILDASYQREIATCDAVPDRSVITLVVNPLDAFFVAIAWAWRVTIADGTDRLCNAQIYAAEIRGCRQLEFVNPCEYVGRATQWINTDDLMLCMPSELLHDVPLHEHPRRAHPIDFGAFTNAALGSPLCIRAGNPHDHPIAMHLTVWGIPFPHCPPWAHHTDAHLPQHVRARQRASVF